MRQIVLTGVRIIVGVTEQPNIVRRYVKPDRDHNKRENYQTFWWRYAEHRPGLYAAIDGLSNILAFAQVSSTVMPVRISTGQVFDQQCVVFALEELSFFSKELTILGVYPAHPFRETFEEVKA